MAKPTKVTNRITELRAVTGMSQAELGDRVGVTRQTVNAIEGGKYSPSLEVAFKVACALGVPLERVFQYPDGGGLDLRK
jgi:putative transcriptional regulator